MRVGEIAGSIVFLPLWLPEVPGLGSSRILMQSWTESVLSLCGSLVPEHQVDCRVMGMVGPKNSFPTQHLAPQAASFPGTSGNRQRDSPGLRLGGRLGKWAHQEINGRDREPQDAWRAHWEHSAPLCYSQVWRQEWKPPQWIQNLALSGHKN